jgi:hypothetical protein
VAGVAAATTLVAAAAVGGVVGRKPYDQPSEGKQRMDRCEQRRGLLGRCKLEKVHPGEHDNGKVTWPRTGSDLRIHQMTLSQLEEMRQERARLQALSDRHDRGEL